MDRDKGSVDAAHGERINGKALLQVSISPASPCLLVFLLLSSLMWILHVSLAPG